MKPRIAIIGEEGFDEQVYIPHFLVARKYPEAVRRAGGLPYLIYSYRLAQEYAAFSSGLLLTGGVNIHAGRYGGIYKTYADYRENNGFIGFSASRDEFDFILFRAFLAAKKPVFGIGRGLQVINVALGGTLKPLAPGDDLHNSSSSHGIEITTTGGLGAALSGLAQVNSFHGLLLDKIGENLEKVAVSSDGEVEALQHTSLPIFGVLWHPERELVTGSEIFKYFITLSDKTNREYE
ncbi:MAG: gamma-glutamyl-gamma-aminobutyrate hydrolase family protein [Treponema sp.]|jgi:putative glutamine amidotransferase|nr:gamma-glutamyl-gamma-aminobutyrate hydrolase family protein [Treponema sp.]